MPASEHPMRFPLLAGMALLVAVTACAAEQTTDATHIRSANPSGLPYPSIDPDLGEELYPDEQALAEEIGVVIERSIRKEYGPGSARRDAHPKAHGCVKAELHVMDTLPDHLAKGIFVPGKSYQAWIRFSNGSRDASQADIKGDARGMAIKVLGVPGKKLLEDEAQATTQDFIMINHSVVSQMIPGVRRGHYFCYRALYCRTDPFHSAMASSALESAPAISRIKHSLYS